MTNGHTALQAWHWQKQLLAHVCALSDGNLSSADWLAAVRAEVGLTSPSTAGDDAPGKVCGCLLLLQHAPVYTLGTGSSTSHLRFDPDDPPLPVYRTERGGEVTYHGPGQLVMYPVMDLRQLQPDLHWYMRGLEEVVIRWASCNSI